MKPSLNLISALLLALVYTSEICRGQFRRAAAFTNDVPASPLGLIKRLTAHSSLQCSVMCLETDSCVSVMFRESFDVCYLLSDNATASFPLPSSVSPTPSPDIYLSMKTPEHVCSSPGIYEDTIILENLGRTTVVCDDNWVVVQRREGQNVDFNRDFKAYSGGFGDVGGDFWWGLKSLHALSSATWFKLRVEMETWQTGTFLYQDYTTFNVSSESDGFRLFVDTGSTGTAGDGMILHSGMQFSTWDHDRDYEPGNCGLMFQAGWWFYDCVGKMTNPLGSNPNGLHQRCAGNFTRQCILWLPAEPSAAIPTGMRKIRLMIQQQ